MLTHRGVARLPKHSLRFVFCPSGLLELRSSQGQNPAVFATLSPDFVELTSSVLLAYPKIHKEPPLRGGSLCIGVARFELTTFCSQSRRSTRLSYTPKCSKYSKDYCFFKRICEKNTCITFFFKKNSLLCTENIDKCPVVHYILYTEIPEPFMTRGKKWKQSMTSAKK